jgi:hypothetical protein
MLAALLATTAAHAQFETRAGSIPFRTKVVDPEEGLPLYKRTMMPPAGYDGWLPPHARALPAALTPPLGPIVPPKPLEPLVMNGGKGGNLQEHQFTFGLLANTGRSVEMRGACWSACTRITSYIPKDRLCFGEGSFLAFHSARRTR